MTKDSVNSSLHQVSPMGRKSYMDTLNKSETKTQNKSKNENEKTAAKQKQANLSYSSQEFSDSEESLDGQAIQSYSEDTDVSNTNINADSNIRKQPTDASSANWQYSYYIAGAALFALCSVFLYFHGSTDVIDVTYLKENHQAQPNETWDHIAAVIDDMLQTKASNLAVFLLLHEPKSNNIDKIVKDLAAFAKTKLDTEVIEIDHKEFHKKEVIDDYGYLLTKYKPELQKKQVMVVKDLQNIPGKVALAFHSFCDEVSPLVKRVVYIFTLKVKSLRGKEEQIAESNLKEHWKELGEDILIPLLTRVTGTVIKIASPL